MNHKECLHKQRCKDSFGGVCPGCKTPKEKLVQVRNSLRDMNVRWDERGPHATYDSPVLDYAILELDELIENL